MRVEEKWTTECWKSSRFIVPAISKEQAYWRRSLCRLFPLIFLRSPSTPSSDPLRFRFYHQNAVRVLEENIEMQHFARCTEGWGGFADQIRCMRWEREMILVESHWVESHLIFPPPYHHFSASSLCPRLSRGYLSVVPSHTLFDSWVGHCTRGWLSADAAWLGGGKRGGFAVWVNLIMSWNVWISSLSGWTVRKILFESVTYHPRTVKSQTIPIR